MEDIWEDLIVDTAARAPNSSLELHSNQGDDNRPINDESQPFSLDKTGPGSRRRMADGDAAERKRKRLMKNREAAVRSRARRQAYTYYLEAKIQGLKEENAELKKQRLQLMYNKQQEENHKPQRTLSASF